MKYGPVLAILMLQQFCFAQVHDLDYFISKAKENSPVIKGYQNQLLLSQLDSQLIKASLGIQVNFISNNSYAPVIKGYGYDEVITNIANVSALVQASRNFLTRTNIAAQYRTIALEKRALLDTLLLSQQDLVKTITDQYITAYSSRLTRDFNQEVYELMKKEEGLLKKLTEANVYRQTDYLTFYVTLQQQELVYLENEIQYNRDYLTLNYLAGLQDTAIEIIPRPAIPDTIMDDHYNSVFYTRFVTDSLRLENERALIAFEYKPKINAYTDAGLNSSLQYNPYKNWGWSAGLILSIPIYDNHQRKMKYGRIEIEERTRKVNRDFALKQYYVQVAMLKNQLVATEWLVSKISNQIEYAHTLIIANGKLLQTGDISMKDYITAVSNYLNSKQLLTKNTIERLRILNEINYWNVRP